jgi:hypothetical protein
MRTETLPLKGTEDLHPSEGVSSAKNLLVLQWVAIGFWHEADVDIEQLIVSRAKLVWVLGLSGSGITQLVEERVIPAPEAHGKYKPAASVRAYCRPASNAGPPPNHHLTHCEKPFGSFQ